MKKIWASGAFFSTLLCVFFFWNPIAGFIVEKLVDRACIECLGVGITHDGYSFSSEEVRFTNPRFTTPDTDSQTGISFSADAIKIRYHFFPWSLTIDADVVIEAPQIILRDRSRLHYLVNRFLEQKTFFSFRPVIEINKGEIRKESETDSKIDRMAFSGSFGYGSVKYVNFLLPGNDNLTPMMKLKASYEEDGSFIFEALLNKTDLGLLGSFLEEIHPVFSKHFIKQGMADGEISGGRISGKRLHVGGAISCRELLLEEKEKKLLIGIGDINFDFSPERSDGVKTYGKIVLGGDTFLSFADTGNRFLQNLEGQIVLEKHGRLSLHGSTICTSDEDRFSLELTGDAKILDFSQSLMNIHFRTLYDDGQTGSATIVFNGLCPLWNCAEISLKNITKREINFLDQIIVSKDTKESNFPVFHSGILNAEAVAYFKGFTIQNLEIKKATVKDLEFNVYPLNFYGSAAGISGSITMNFSESDFLKTTDADLMIEEGIIHFVGYDKELWKLSNLDTGISFKNGVIQKSVAQANFAGLSGTIEMDWLSDDEVFKLRFGGNPSKIGVYVNDQIRRGVAQKFPDDFVEVNIGVKPKKYGFYVEGLLEVFSHSLRTRENIAFGFDVLKTGAELPTVESISSKAPESKDFETIGKRIKDESDRLKDNFPHLSIANGWIFGENLPLERYIGPFLFQPDNEEDLYTFNLEGIGVFRGKFDRNGVAIDYSASNVVLETGDFRMEIPRINTGISQVGFFKDAFHYLDFRKPDHFGSMPVIHGSYLDKNTGLLFKEVSTKIDFEGNTIRCTNVEGFCSDLFFSGNICVKGDSGEKGSFDIDILLDTMAGKLSGLQTLFSGFNKSPMFTDFPIDGDIFFRDGGANLFFEVRPEKTNLFMKISAVLVDGIIKFHPLDISLRELGMNIDYDKRKNTLVLDNIRGTLLTGKPGKIEEYVFSGDKIAFSDFSNNIGTFDLWIGDKNREIIRLAGKTTGGREEGNENNDRVSFELDKNLTHFSDVYPSDFILTLKNWQIPEEFLLDMRLNLSSLYSDIKRACRAGVFFLPENLLAEIDKIGEAQGDFKIRLAYENEKGIFSYDAIGSKLAAGPYNCDTMLLTGSVRDNIWTVDQFRFDDISIAAEIRRLENSRRINFLGLRAGNSILLGIEGDIPDGADRLDAKINLLEIYLDKLNEWPKLAEFIEKNQPKGILRGNGSFVIEKNKSGKYANYDGFFTLTGNDIVLRDIAFGEAKNFSCHIQHDQGVIFRNISSTMLSPDGKDKHVRLNIEKMHYDFHEDRTNAEGIKFYVPNRCLKWFAAKLRYAFYEDISGATETVIAGIKETEDFNCFLDLHYSAKKFGFVLRFPEGIYHYKGENIYLSDFEMDYEPGDMKISTGYRHGRKDLFLTFRSTDPAQERGTLFITNKNASPQNAKEEFFAINWQNDPYKGFHIDNIKGKLGGLTLNFSGDFDKALDENFMYMVGEASMKIPEATLFCEGNIFEKCRDNKMAGELRCNGKLALSKNPDSITNFMGTLYGENFGFKGYLFDNVNGVLKYNPDNIKIEKFSVRDSAGIVSAPEMYFYADTSDLMNMKIPILYISNFRPRKLKEMIPESPTKSNSLIINSIEVNNITGKIGDVNTWTGSGKMKFSNPPKTNLQNTILAFPHELITRIGLNPSVLTPITGNLFYKLSDGKIIFTKFKDIYSESKGSKFYLPPGSSPSYIDFDGNMYIQVRMKQYNLLFKFAELMTVTIKGTLEKPVYSIRQEKGRRSR